MSVHTPQLAQTQHPYLWLGLFLCALLCLAGCSQLATNDTDTAEAQAQALLTQAAEQEAAGDTQAAIQTLQQINAAYGASQAAVTAQQEMSRLLLAEAEAQRTAGNYEAALQAYGGINDPALLAQADTAVVETYLEWVTALLAADQFDTAATQLTTLQNLRGDDPDVRQKTAVLHAELALAQGQAALADGDIPTAYVNYTAVLSQDPAQIGDIHDTAVASFQTDLADPLFAYGQERATAADYSKAALAFEAIAQYGPDSLIAPAEAQAAEMTLRWGEALLAEQDFPGASEKFEYVLAFYPQSDSAATAEARWADAQVAQVQASGVAGQLPAPESSATSGASHESDTATAVYRVQNDTPCPILILLSGPQSQVVRLSPTAVQETTIAAGAYGVVVQPDQAANLSDTCRDISPFLGEYNLTSGTTYTSRFFVSALDE